MDKFKTFPNQIGTKEKLLFLHPLFSPPPPQKNKLCSIRDDERCPIKLEGVMVGGRRRRRRRRMGHVCVCECERRPKVEMGAFRHGLDRG